MLCDYPEFRGQFIFSTMTSDIAFLDAKGHMHLFKSEIQGAILAVFREQEVRPAPARDPEFLPQINVPPVPAVPPPPVQVRGMVSLEAYVTSIERLAKAMR
jgi:hypothetical protein